MNNLEKNNINLLIDFDSTIINTETIEEIAAISLKNNSNKNNIKQTISKLTNQAMNGEISFPDALDKRVKLLQANKIHINKTIELLNHKISTSFSSNKKFIQSISNRCFIVSGGFTEIIYPIVQPFNISYKNIYANEFLYKGDDIKSIDKTNNLAKNLGKALIAKNIIGNNIIIGDGYTDYEVKREKAACKFIQYAENINREKLNPYADLIAYNFDDIIYFINNLNLL